MSTQLQTAGQTDVGRLRQDNQDTFISKPLWSDQSALLVVIDGVGGYAGGAEAAAIAQESIEQYMAAPTGDTLTMLREAVVYANNQIVHQKEQDPELARMCCVLTVAVADAEAGRLYYTHVGDTRMYRFRQGQLDKITHDHSVVGSREDANLLTEREAMSHPLRNLILRDIGSAPHRIDDPDFLESGETDLLPGDKLLLCSDGLTDMLPRAQMIDVLTQSTPVEEQIEELIRQANEAGGQDNITVVLAHYTGSTDEPVREPSGPIAEEKPVPKPVAERKPTPKPVALAETTPRPARNWGQTALILLLLIGVAGVLWWQYGSSVSDAKPQPARADSSAYSKPVDQPDSIRTP